jgi:MFS family permease
VLVTVAVLGLVSIFGINMQVLGPPLARDVLGSDAAGYGFLMSGFGVGALVAALGITVLGTRPGTVVAGAVALGVAEIALGVSRSLPLSLALAAIAGLGAVAVAATGNVTLQLAAPDQMRGRVMSVYAVVFDGTAPIGGLLMGAIASNAGAAVAIGLGGAASALTGVAGALWLRRIADRAARTRTYATTPVP